MILYLFLLVYENLQQIYARDIQYITFMDQWKHASRLNYSYFLNPTYKQTLTQLLQIKYNDMAIAEYKARKVIG